MHGATIKIRADKLKHSQDFLQVNKLKILTFHPTCNEGIAAEFWQKKKKRDRKNLRQMA